VVAVAAFLRVINALENIRQSLELLTQSAALGFFGRAQAEPLLKRAVAETGDSIEVLSGGGLHPEAVAQLVEAQRLAERAASSLFNRRGLTRSAIKAQERARSQLIEVRK
jgi:copper homeostasis protein CutC